MAKKKPSSKETTKSVETITHTEDKRKNIPTIEYRSMVREDQQSPVPVRYPRNTDLDPQLVWRGKDEQDWSDLVVHAPPLYIQEKVHPKVLIDDLLRQTEKAKWESEGSKLVQLDLFSDFNGVPEGDAKTEFYQHDQNWSNRMILGDSLQVMASLAEREGLRGKVQCIYFDPPYGIKFNSNFQWSTTSRDVKDGKSDHITREPEQVKAFRDTWRDGIHSYLTYLRDRLSVARDLLADSGSIFVQIGDENMHRVRAVIEEVFGEDNFCRVITIRKTAGDTTQILTSQTDYILWAAKKKDCIKYRPLFLEKEVGIGAGDQYDKKLHKDSRSFFRLTSEEIKRPALVEKNWLIYRTADLRRAGFSNTATVSVTFRGREFHPGQIRQWKTPPTGLARLRNADRFELVGNTLEYRRYFEDWKVTDLTNLWLDSGGSGFGDEKVYVVQTITRVIQRCVLMSTDPGDLVIDPTCGSGTTATVAEQWGRRWITIDTSRVALALARARIMGARYPFYLLADSKEGQVKEADVMRSAPSTNAVHNNVRHGFIYERVPHITLKSIANNTEIDVIWDKWQQILEPLRVDLNKLLKRKYEEWEIPREAEDPWHVKPTTIFQKIREEQALGEDTRPTKLKELLADLNKELKRKQPFTLETLPERPADPWDKEPAKIHKQWWDARIARQKEIDASIAAKAEFEYLYDKPYEDKKKVRVAGPFTVESLSPHRTLGVDENDNLIDPMMVKENRDEKQSFAQMILDNLKTAGVQQADKSGKIDFISLVPWPGQMVCAEGTYQEGDAERRAAIMIGPEFGTVQRQDLVLAAREAGDAGFDVLIACAFNFDAMSTEFNKLGRIPVLKARINADLHMADDLKNTGKGNLFVIFGEPDVEVVSGLWLVASNGRMVSSYDRIKELSRLGSLEEINRLGGSNLRRFKDVSSGRAVWTDESDSKSSGISSVKHSRGSRKDGNGGISELSEHGDGITSGSGDAVDLAKSAGDDSPIAGRPTLGTNSGNQPYARWTKEIAAIQELTTSDFPLALTTNHYSQVTVHGVDVFHPNTGEVRSDGPEGIACWFIDTDYNEESFFVRHAYFLGQNDPYTALKTTLKAEIDADAWSTLHSDTSRPFEKPRSGRIAVKVINHLGDEVMKVFKV